MSLQVQDPLGLTAKEVAWCRENVGTSPIAQTMLYLYDQTLADPHNLELQDKFDIVLRELRHIRPREIAVIDTLYAYIHHIDDRDEIPGGIVGDQLHVMIGADLARMRSMRGNVEAYNGQMNADLVLYKYETCTIMSADDALAVARTLDPVRATHVFTVVGKTEDGDDALRAYIGKYGVTPMVFTSIHQLEPVEALIRQMLAEDKDTTIRVLSNRNRIPLPWVDLAS